MSISRAMNRVCFSFDKERVLLIKRLKWKFRGNERVEVDGVSWDVYNWLFEDNNNNGQAVFMLRFENLNNEEQDDDENRQQGNDSKQKLWQHQRGLGGGLSSSSFWHEQDRLDEGDEEELDENENRV